MHKKLEIPDDPKEILLNKLSEVISQCRHRNKYKLKPLVSHKHFPPGNKFYKIFNKNILKLSYSCMPNLKDKIDGHNNKILEITPPPKTLCNCLKKENCPKGASLKIFYTTVI